MPPANSPYMTVVFYHAHDVRAREQLCEQLGQVAHLYGSKIVRVSHVSGLPDQWLENDAAPSEEVQIS